MLGRVMNREAIPQLYAELRAKVIGKRFPAMNIEVVDHQVNGARQWIPPRDPGNDLGELHARTARRGKRKVPSRPGFHGTEHIGGGLPFVHPGTPEGRTGAGWLCRPPFAAYSDRI